MNNVAEMTRLEMGMSLVFHVHCRRIKIVGDPCLIIDMV